MILTSTAFRNKLQDTKNRVLRSAIYVYDTKMCVPTVGIPFVMYEEADSGDHTFSDQILPVTDSYGVVPNLSLSWSYGVPFYMNVPHYSVEVDGYFYAEETSTALKFYVFGHGVTVNLDFNSVSVISDTELNHDPSVFANSSNISVTGGNWYTFTLQFWGDAGIRNAGISVQYTYDTTVDEDDFRSASLKVVNAGVCNANNSFISSGSVTHFGNLNGTRSKNEPTTYSFDVPIGDKTGAYMKNSSNEYTNGTVTLQEGNLIKIFAGYECDTTPTQSQTEGTVVSDVEYIPRFTGYIDGFEINTESNTMRVNCIDFFGITQSNFCINYPDAASYWSARYFKDSYYGEPYGLFAPTTYDKWGVVDSILDLFIKSGIPASLFYGMEYARQSDETIAESIPSVYNAGFQLGYARYYGTDLAENYINVYDVGTTIYEAIMKIVDTYGYYIDFKPNGNLRFYPQDNPTANISDGDSPKIDDAEGATSGTVSLVTSPKATRGNYSQIETTDGTITFSDIPATGFTLIVKRDTTSGASDNSNQYWSGTASVKIEIKINGGAVVETYNYNFYFSEEWFYTDGVSPLVGANPCVIPLEKALDYDNYDVIVTNLNGTYNISVDELWVYHHNISEPVKILQTYKTVDGIAAINNINFERKFEDLRNDILVVGQRRGIWVPTGAKEVGIDDPDMASKTNSQYVNYHSRAIDIESIYNPFSDNYTGRHLMTYIQEPNINTDSRARWLAYSVLRNYRDFDNRINVSVVGDPEITISDPITVLDKFEEDATDLFWVNGIRESITKMSWEIGLDVIGKQPYPSYDEDPDYDISQFNNSYFANMTVTDNFGYSRDGSQKATLDGTHVWTATTLNLNEDVSDWNSAGSLVVYKPFDFTENGMEIGSPHYGIFVYSSKGASSVTGEFVYVTPNGDDIVYMPWDGWLVENIYNPYEQSDYGGFMKISFTCLVDGNISVGVKSTKSGLTKFVTGISAGGGLDDSFLPKEQKVFPGDVVELIWGGVDETGVTHEVTGEENEIGGGFFAEDGIFQFFLNYQRESDGTIRPLTTGSYYDDTGTKQRDVIEIAKSTQDKHKMSFEYASSGYSNNYNQYYPGSSGRRMSYYNGEKQNINRVWVRGVDGMINISMNSYYTDTPRPYFITYRVQGVYAKSGISSATGSQGSDFTMHIYETTPMEQKQYNDGNPVKWSNTNDYIIPFDPVYNKFGAMDFDSDWLSYYAEHIDEPYISAFGLVSAKAYWLRFIMDIRDASGRRVRYVDDSGVEHQVASKQSDIDVMDVCMYSDPNYDTVLELFQVPSSVDLGEGGWRVLDKVIYLLPIFEAPGTKYPICIVE